MYTNTADLGNQTSFRITQSGLALEVWNLQSGNDSVLGFGAEGSLGGTLINYYGEEDVNYPDTEAAIIIPSEVLYRAQILYGKNSYHADTLPRLELYIACYLGSITFI